MKKLVLNFDKSDIVRLNRFKLTREALIDMIQSTLKFDYDKQDFLNHLEKLKNIFEQEHDKVSI